MEDGKHYGVRGEVDQSVTEQDLEIDLMSCNRTPRYEALTGSRLQLLIHAERFRRLVSRSPTEKYIICVIWLYLYFLCLSFVQPFGIFVA